MIIFNAVPLAFVDPIQTILSSRGFVWNASKEAFVNADRTAWFKFGHSEIDVPESRIDLVMKGFDKMSQRGWENVRGTQSGMPLGRDIRFCMGPSEAILEACSFQFCARVTMQCGKTRVSGTPRPISPMTVGDFAMVESVSRWILATKTADAYSPSTHPIGNQSVSSRRANNVRIHLDAQRWSEIKGYTININRQTACTMINRPQGAIIMPLGAPKVKVGSEWIDIEDIVLADGDRPLIPLQIINRLN